MFFIVSCKTQEIITVELKQDGVLMNPTILPNSIYHTSVMTENNAVIEYFGNDDIIENFKTSGIEYPLVSNTTNLIGTTMETGKVTASGGFSVNSTYDTVEESLTGSMAKLKGSNGILKQFLGVRTFGNIDSQMQVSVDSIVGLENEALRSTIEQGMKSILNQVAYPNEYVQVGDSFSISMPIVFPIVGGKVMDMVIETKYLLDSISNTIAYFSLDQNITLGVDEQEVGIVIYGEGNGSIEYDMVNQNNQYYYTELKMNSTVDIEPFGVKSESINKTTVKTEIEKK